MTDDVLLEIKTFDYQRGSWMQGRETAAEMCERFRGELQDYVATGTCGWGQWRH